MTPSHRTLLYTGIAYLGFVIYGSLVPLTFRPISLGDACNAFINIRYLNLGIGSRADWVANILLFVPLSFLWLGVFWPSNGTEAIISATLWMLSVGLSAGIEFTQLFFPPRTVSMNDIVAEGIGAAIGIAVWWNIGPKLVRWFGTWTSKNTKDLPERFLWLYLALLFGYNLLPLDLTISPVEIYHKWKEGRLILTPLQFHMHSNVSVIYELAIDAVVWSPLALLLTIRQKQTALKAWLWTVAAATVVEFLQIFVFSRVTDVNDIITAMIGAGGGVCLGLYMRSQSARKLVQSRVILRSVAWGLVTACLLILVLVSWYPFNFRFDIEYFYHRLEMFGRVPFYTYYYGTEFHAVTEVLHKILFFLPLGAAMSLAFRGAETRSRSPHWAALILCSLTALVIELGQTLLPGRYPDSTDLVLEMFGGILGCRLGALVWNILIAKAEDKGLDSR